MLCTYHEYILLYVYGTLDLDIILIYTWIFTNGWSKLRNKHENPVFKLFLKIIFLENFCLAIWYMNIHSFAELFIAKFKLNSNIAS